MCISCQKCYLFVKTKLNDKKGFYQSNGERASASRVLATIDYLIDAKWYITALYTHVSRVNVSCFLLIQTKMRI